MKNDNKEALKSSALVAVAFALLSGAICGLNGSNYTWLVMGVSGFAGLVIGLLTTWYPDEMD